MDRSVRASKEEKVVATCNAQDNDNGSIAVSCDISVRSAFRKLLETDCKLTNVFDKNDSVLVKPNLVLPRKRAVTNLELIDELCKLAEVHGTKLEIIERPGLEFDPDIVANYLELKRFARRYGVRIDLNPTRFRKLEIPGKYLKKLSVVEDYFEKPWINVFKIKTHVLSKVTLGVKNTMGILGYDTRQDIHIHGVNKSLTDLIRAIKPTYNLAEGYPAMEGNGPMVGELRPINMLAGCSDMAELDLFLVRSVMKIDAEKVDYLRGRKQLSAVIGDVTYPTGVAPFKEPKVRKAYVAAFNSMYFVDKPFFALFHRHFNQFLYSSRLFGTKPALRDKTAVRQLKDICRFEAIDYTKARIDYDKCILCMECVDSHPEVFKIVSATRGRLRV